MSPRRRACRILSIAAACLLGASAVAQDAASPGSAPAVELGVTLSAVAKNTVVTLGAAPNVPVGTSETFTSDPNDYVPASVDRADGNGAAIFHLREARVTVVATGLPIEFQLRIEQDGGAAAEITIPPTDALGWVDLYHDADRPPVYVNIIGGSGDAAPAKRSEAPLLAKIGMFRGAVRVRRVSPDGGFEIVSGAGMANVVTMAEQRAALESGAKNQVLLAPNGVLSELDRREGITGEMDAARSAILQQSVLPEFVRVAEEVAEGDIEPPARGSIVVAAAVAPTVRVREIVPRGGVVTRVAAGAVSSGRGGAAQSTAEQFLGAGEAALAVVGARFERTRVTGATGLRPPLAINRELRSRFSLGRGSLPGILR